MVPPQLPADPLFRRTPLPLDVIVAVLGVPVRFRSNSAAVMAAVHESFGRWAPEPVAGEPEVDCRVILHPGTEVSTVRPPIQVRMPDADRLIWRTAGSVGLVDLSRSDAVAYVTEALLADPEHYRVTMLEGMTLVLVANRDRLPVHAAMIERGGRTVMLVGPTGRGKSTLAYAAWRRGWRVLADDGAYVQTAPALRVWGRPAPLLMPAESGERFPELAGREPTRQATGKLKIPVDTGIVRQPDPVIPAAICVLERGPAVKLERLAPADLVASLAGQGEAGLEPYGDRPARVAALLSGRDGWRLTLGDDPGAAVELIDQMAG